MVSYVLAPTLIQLVVRKVYYSQLGYFTVIAQKKTDRVVGEKVER